MQVRWDLAYDMPVCDVEINDTQPIKHKLGETYHEVHWSNQTLAWTSFLHFFLTSSIVAKDHWKNFDSSNGIVSCHLVVNQHLWVFVLLTKFVEHDCSIWCHQGMSPVPSPHWPLLNPEWPQISHMPLSTPTFQQNSSLMAFLAQGQKLWRRTYERIVQKWLYSAIVIYML